MKPWMPAVSALTATALLAACGGSDSPKPPPEDPAMRVALSVLSSEPQWVSGGDARIHVRAAPGQRDKLELWLNGNRLDAALHEVDDGLEGVITGLAPGENQLEVRHSQANTRDTLTLTNWPITGPMFTGPQQTPFVCTTNQGAVGQQPKVDSATAPGYKVTDASGNLIGYSRDCSIDTAVSYFYRPAGGGALLPLPAGERPTDMGTTTLADGRTVDFVVRREVGSVVEAASVVIVGTITGWSA